MIAPAENSISFVDYNEDLFPFDEDGVTDSDIIEHFYCECDVFALNADGKVSGFDDEEETEAAGCTVIDIDEAYTRLAKERPGLDFDLSC
jgi:hypothetical protein